MKLQLSLDLLTLTEALEISQDLKDTVDILEIGTPMLYKYGLYAVQELKKALPYKTVLADMKIMDGGEIAAAQALNFGADIITVMAAADGKTIENAIRKAHIGGALVMVDLLGVEDKITRALALELTGADYLCLHTPKDIQNEHQSPLDDLIRVKHVLQHGKTAIAGGIELGSLGQVIKAQPDIVIVGGGILNTSDPVNQARIMADLIHNQ
jgi:3-hexulose-6-phosphate synthase